jgi:hypothetical protein
VGPAGDHPHPRRRGARARLLSATDLSHRRAVDGRLRKDLRPAATTQPEDDGDARIAELEKALEWSPSIANREALALAYVEAQRWREAADVARPGADQKPPDEHLLYLLCAALVQLGDAEAAERLDVLEARYPDFRAEEREEMRRAMGVGE